MDVNKDSLKNNGLIYNKTAGKILELSNVMIVSKDNSWITGLLEILGSIGFLKKPILVEHKCKKILEKLPEIKKKMR